MVIDIMVRYTKQILKGPAQTKYQFKISLYKESVAVYFGDHWTLGYDIGDVTNNCFGKVAKANGFDSNGKSITGIFCCKKFEQ